MGEWQSKWAADGSVSGAVAKGMGSRWQRECGSGKRDERQMATSAGSGKVDGQQMAALLGEWQRKWVADGIVSGAVAKGMSSRWQCQPGSGKGDGQQMAT